MSEPLKYKIEKTITGWIAKAASPALSGWTYYQGQCPLMAVVPFITCVIQEARESFPDSLPKDVRLDVQIVSAMDIDQNANMVEGEPTDQTINWTNHRAAVAAVEARLQDFTGLQAYANKVNVADRPVSDFYLYDLQEDLQHSAAPGASRLFLSTIRYTAVCEAQDN